MTMAWQLEEIAIAGIQSQVAQIIAQHGIDNTPLSQNMGLTEKFVHVLEELDHLGHLLSDKEPVAILLIQRQVFKVAALAAMFGESLIES